MTLRWTNSAAGDLNRLHQHLRRVAPDAAARVARQLVQAAERLLEFPRLGEKLEAYASREVRRVFVGEYELRYEVPAAAIIVLRLLGGVR